MCLNIIWVCVDGTRASIIGILLVTESVSHYSLTPSLSPWPAPCRRSVTCSSVRGAGNKSGQEPGAAASPGSSPPRTHGRHTAARLLWVIMGITRNQLQLRHTEKILVICGSVHWKVIWSKWNIYIYPTFLRVCGNYERRVGGGDLTKIHRVRFDAMHYG